MDLWTGESVADGRYVIGGVVGRGREARVHAARDRILQRAVAVKFFPTTPTGSVSARWRDEASALGRLDHPRIVRLLDGGETTDASFLVLPLLTGSLETRLARGPLSRQEASGIVVALAEALGHVHRAGFVHGAVDVQGVLFDDAGQPCWGGLPDPIPATDGRGADRDMRALAVVAVRCVTGDDGRRTAPSPIVEIVRNAALDPDGASRREQLSRALESVAPRERRVVDAARRRARPGIAAVVGLGFAASVLTGLVVDVGTLRATIGGGLADAPGGVVLSDPALHPDVTSSVRDAMSRLGAVVATPAPRAAAADRASTEAPVDRVATSGAGADTGDSTDADPAGSRGGVPERGDAQPADGHDSDTGRADGGRTDDNESDEDRPDRNLADGGRDQGGSGHGGDHGARDGDDSSDGDGSTGDGSTGDGSDDSGSDDSGSDHGGDGPSGDGGSTDGALDRLL